MKLVKVGATWCGPCKALDKAIKESTQVQFLDYVQKDLDSLQSEEVQELKVRGVPTLILYDNSGQEIQRKSGAMKTSEFDEWIKLGLATTQVKG